MALKNVLILPDGNLAIFPVLEEQERQHDKLVEFEKRETVNLAFLKVIEKLPRGCRSFLCIQKLLKSFPILPFSCSNCSCSTKLLLKAGFCSPPLTLCQECPELDCSQKTPLERMRKILFGRCVLLKGVRYEP